MHGIKGRVKGDCDKAYKGGKLSGGGAKGGHAGKGKLKAKPPTEPQKLRIVAEVDEWQGVNNHLLVLGAPLTMRKKLTVLVMSFLYGEQSRADEMFDSLGTSVAPYKVAFKRYVERHIKTTDIKYNSMGLGKMYAEELTGEECLRFKEDKVRTFARNLKKALRNPLTLPA